jgi:hypothetical protein
MLAALVSQCNDVAFLAGMQWCCPQRATKSKAKQLP